MEELTDELKKEYQAYNKRKLNETFVFACINGRLDVVKYLLTSSDISKHVDLHVSHDEGFRYACKHGHLEIVKYLLTSKELKKHADIHTQNDYGFRLACQGGHLEVVKYLLTSPDLKEHANIHADNDGGFQWVCANGSLEIVQYLLTSPDLKEHADIHTENDRAYLCACYGGRIAITNYLLSFNGKHCITFQHTEYNLNWAIYNRLNDVIIAMMKNLKNNNPFEYLECLPKIEKYNKEIYEQIKNIEVDGDEVNSPSEAALYL